MRFQVGQKAGDYEFLALVEATHTGVSYRVQNLLADREELLKVLPADLQEDQERVERFLREAKIHARLHHPHIAAFYTATRVDGRLVMTSELVEGTSLEQRISSGSLSVEEARKYFDQALSALSYAHGEGVVHRDIKPGHLIITSEDNVKITGFGLAKKATDAQLTQPGIVMGSVHYMSPEQVKGSTELDRRSDIYSLGVVLYEAVTGRKPFDSKSQFEVFVAHVKQEPAPPSSLRAEIPPALDQIILTAMAKQPGSRFQTAAEFRHSLGKLGGALGDPAAATAHAAAQQESLSHAQGQATATRHETPAPPTAAEEPIDTNRQTFDPGGQPGRASWSEGRYGEGGGSASGGAPENRPGERESAAARRDTRSVFATRAGEARPENEHSEHSKDIPLLLRPTGSGAHGDAASAKVPARDSEASAASWFGEHAFAGWTSKDILAVGALTFVIVAAVFFALLTFLNR
jgi:serine/threonine-protein kinase